MGGRPSPPAAPAGARAPPLRNRSLDSRPASSRRGDDPAATLLLEDPLHRESHQRTAMLGDQRGCGLLLEQLLNAGESSQGSHGQPPIGNGGEERMNRTTGV